VDVSWTLRCASFWDALVLGSILEERGVQVRRPDEEAPLSMVASGAPDGIRAGLAQLSNEFPHSGPVIIEGEDRDGSVPEPSPQAPAPKPSRAPGPSRRIPAPEASRQAFAPKPSIAPKQSSQAPAAKPSRQVPAPEPPPQPQAPKPPSAAEPSRQAQPPKPPRQAEARKPPSTPKPAPQVPAPEPPPQPQAPKPPSAAEPSRRAQVPEPSRGSEPSWGTVLATSVRLWSRRRLRRWWPTRARWRLAVVAALVAVVFVAGGVMVALSGSGAGRQAAGVLAAGARQRAAGWVAGQAAAEAIVACDPAMCAALQGRGVPVGRLLVLSPARADPLGSDLVVATPAVRSRFGARLTAVYAPVILAAFGSGAARIEVRAVAPHGAAAYRARLAADVQARRAAGASLLHNPGIRAAGTARAELADGQVDTRLLVTLAALSHLHPVDVLSFGRSGPGASAGVPLRSADIAGAALPGGHPASLTSLRAFFRAQWAPYLPASLATVRVTPRRAVLRVGYRIPCPLGLLGSRS